MQRIVRNYYEQVYAKKLGNLGIIYKSRETYNLPKLNQEETENMNRPITTTETEAVIRTPGTQKPWTRRLHR